MHYTITVCKGGGQGGGTNFINVVISNCYLYCPFSLISRSWRCRQEPYPTPGLRSRLQWKSYRQCSSRFRRHSQLRKEIEVNFALSIKTWPHKNHGFL